MFSANSSQSSRTSKSSTPSLGRYRTKAKTSQVDDLLFGSSNVSNLKKARQQQKASKEETLHFTAGNVHLPSQQKKSLPSKKTDTIRVITKDLIRDVVVPRDDDQKDRKVIISRDSYDFLSWKANTVDQSDNEVKQQVDAERDQIMADIQKRKAEMDEADLSRKAGHPLNDLEKEAITQAEELQQRYQQKRLEENDEIKHLNELILEARCHAIRDEQIAEKKKLREEMFAENNRLDAMMEIDRIEAIQQQESIDRKRKEQRQAGAQQILDQIAVNESEKVLQEELKDAEARMMVEKQKQLQVQDLTEIQNRLLQQKELQEEIDLINETTRKNKAVRAAEEKMAELRVAQYQEKKDAEQKIREEQEAEVRRQKEIEIAKLRKAQERASDLAAERDALRAKRHEEFTEREYRRKVREELAKKQVMEAEMAAAREEQISAKRHLMAVQAARERAEFDKQLLEQKKEVERTVKANQLRSEDLRSYAKDVRSQIADREEKRIQERKAFFEETISKDKEIDEKNRQLEEVKKRKLQNLKESGVPEKYVYEVARRIGLISIDE